MKPAKEYEAKEEAARKLARDMRAKGLVDEAKDFDWIANGWRELAERAERQGDVAWMNRKSGNGL